MSNEKKIPLRPPRFTSDKKGVKSAGRDSKFIVLEKNDDK